MATTPRGVFYPVSTDQIAPLETVFATVASSVDQAITDAISGIETDIAALDDITEIPLASFVTPVGTTIVGGYARKVGKVLSFSLKLQQVSGGLVHGEAQATINTAYLPKITTVPVPLYGFGSGGGTGAGVIGVGIRHDPNEGEIYVLSPVGNWNTLEVSGTYILAA